MPVDHASLEVTRHQLASVCDAMGAALMRAASSPNIKERLDFSCAVFDPAGRMLAQAAHIPVHLGALPAAVAAARAAGPWRRGDAVLLNDPYAGGSHLPDLTLVSAVFGPDAPNSRPVALLVSRAHHADIGGMSAGSLPFADDLFGEGLILPPVRLFDRGRRVRAVWDIVAANSRTPEARHGDLEAQWAAHRAGERRLAGLLAAAPGFLGCCEGLLTWSRDLALAGWAALPPGTARFTDTLDDNGRGIGPLRIQARVSIGPEGLDVDFAGTARSCAGGLNAPLAVTRSAAFYVACCLLPTTPMNDGLFSTVRVEAPKGSLLDPIRPAAVAGGNVETSQRIVDVLFGALAAIGVPGIPAASQGTMNNVLAGGCDADGRPWAYYETAGGGGGAGPSGAGASGLQVHMTNTRNTPIEALEAAFPIRVERYALRRGSGGRGRWSGGDGIIRRLRFLAPATVTVLSDRRRTPPYGLAGGGPGAVGVNRIQRAGRWRTLPGKATFAVDAGDAIEIRTPGGGGWGEPDTERAPVNAEHLTR
ncbi:MAG: hydantoinase B/oxoprolinase family protein [Ardenticatenales bacterium]